MDVGELLSYKPDISLKHQLEDKDGEHRSESGRSRKRSRRAPAMHPDRAESPVAIEVSEKAQQRLQELEKQLPNTDDQQLSGPLDEAQVKKIALNFEKKLMKNQELRIKFPDDPRKFLDSELELNEGIQELHVLATVPELYPLLVELGTIQSILSLLSHENSDITIAVVDLIQEMTEIDENEESDGPDDLVEALLDGQLVATLVHNLSRLDETNKHEADGVHNTLGIIENLAELRPNVCNEAGPGGLMGWLLKRIRAKLPFDANKLYASEILAICVQSNEENRKKVGEMEGIDVLLQQLASYKRHDPHSEEEQEMMENLFDTLCSCLMSKDNRELFLRGEGLQLMNLMLREKKISRNGALRVLDHALNGAEGGDNCNKFVDILGLRTIFPLFMKTPKKHGKKGLSKEQHEEHVISIIVWLLKNCRPNQRQRLLSKFTENDHEKVDRLLEFHFKYLEKVLVSTSLIEEQAKQDGLDDDQVYLRRLDGGLFTLQLVDYIMLDICATGPPSIKRRVLKILNVRNASIKTIKNIMRDYATNIGDEDDIHDDTASSEQDKILDLLDKFQNS